ncbi:MAG: FkbM family methyltransferase [Erythrobacter sp.]
MNRADPITMVAHQWPRHSEAEMARDFMVWRHLRVVRARGMRHVRGGFARLGGAQTAPVRSVYGVKMWPNWSDRTFAYCHYGTYGCYLADLIGSINFPFCFLDIGANQGLFSLIAGQNPACEKIVALEPVGQTHGRLVANLEANALTSRADALNFGLSNETGEFPITLSAEHSGMATLSAHGAQLPGFHPKTTVRLETMAKLAQHLPDDIPIFVKIDVEGHEEVVLRELLSSTKAQRVIGIFYEQDDRWTDAKAVGEILASANFAEQYIYGRGKHYDVLAVPQNL